MMPLAGHTPERPKQLVVFSINAVGKLHAICGDASPDLKQIVLRFGRNFVRAH